MRPRTARWDTVTSDVRVRPSFKPINAAYSTDARRPWRTSSGLSRWIRFRYVRAGLSTSDWESVQFLLPAGFRGPRFWRDGIKSPIACSEELAGGSWRREPLSRQYSSMQCVATLADASNVLNDGGAPRCAAVQCDAMRCLFVGFEGRGSITTPPVVVAVVDEGPDGQAERQKKR